MKVMILLLLLLIAIGAEATSSDVAAAPNQVNYLCWHLLVETNNIRDWDTVPPQCKCYVSKYMTGQQYRDYCNAVVDAAIKYAKTLNVSKDGKDLWVFNVDETTLSNVPYYFRPTVGFGRAPGLATASPCSSGGLLELLFLHFYPVLQAGSWTYNFFTLFLRRAPRLATSSPCSSGGLLDFQFFRPVLQAGSWTYSFFTLFFRQAPGLKENSETEK
ncbi:hypothetical protein T459_11038 [Capsicum annuum]|uniref:Acid phosphatase 1-like n=1 Tax=Capsicum annuum TaxID=4072 RepID=A0A2G3A3X0_CAPAN|nr:hypothetical protein T459_11038 [Capsicum annuum]